MGAPVVFSSGFKFAFKFAFVAIWKVSCGELRDCFTRCTNPQLAAKCEQIYCTTSCEFNERAAKPKVVVQSRAALSYENNELIAQGEDCEELETSAKLTVFVSNISSSHLKRRYTRYVFLFLVFRRL